MLMDFRKSPEAEMLIKELASFNEAELAASTVQIVRKGIGDTEEASLFMMHALWCKKFLGEQKRLPTPSEAAAYLEGFNDRWMEETIRECVANKVKEFQDAEARLSPHH